MSTCEKKEYHLFIMSMLIINLAGNFYCGHTVKISNWLNTMYIKDVYVHIHLIADFRLLTSTCPISSDSILHFSNQPCIASVAYIFNPRSFRTLTAAISKSSSSSSSLITFSPPLIKTPLTGIFAPVESSAL